MKPDKYTCIYALMVYKTGLLLRSKMLDDGRDPLKNPYLFRETRGLCLMQALVKAQWSGTAFSLIAIRRGCVSRMGLNYELFRRKVRLIVCD